MKFGPVPLSKSIGKILGHNIAGNDGRRALRKGRVISAEDVVLMEGIGCGTIYVAELASDDIGENEAAWRIGTSVMGGGIKLAGPAAGRANLIANVLGVVRVDVGRVAQLNECQGITVATRSNHTAIHPRDMIATVKIIPFAVPANVLQKAEAIGAEGGPIIENIVLPSRVVTLILSGSPSVRERITREFEPSLSSRLKSLNAQIKSVEFVTLGGRNGELSLADKIRSHVEMGSELMVLAGETAIVDQHDIVPRAIERAGGHVVCYGVPVDPGNLLLLGYVGSTPVLGAPGCTRSWKTNVIDWVLPRLLVGDRLSAADFVGLGHGGLLDEIRERPRPRNQMVSEDDGNDSNR